MHENDGVRIAHRNRRDVPDAALYPQRPVNEILAGPAHRDILGSEAGFAHVHRHRLHFSAGDMKPERQNTRQRLDTDLLLIRMPVVVDVLAYAADAVAAHFGLRAVRIEHPHPKIRLAGIGGRANENEPVAAYAKVPIADAAGQRFRAGNGCLERIHIHIIVSGSLHLGKPHVCFPYR